MESRAGYSLLDVWKKYWKTLLSISIYAFGQNYIRATRRIILTFQGNILQFSENEIGLINSYSYIPDSLLFPLAGYLMDNYGRKYTSIPSLTLFILATMLVPFTSNQLELTMVALLYGCADGIATGLIMTIGADLAPNECRSQFIG